ncbi:short tail fiber protein [Vibrio phage 2.275.O._10N.286.54.E11]|nr:short tail fiber protein [Vibrio phage 2.275.O._10N.286.54.E11]
MTISFNNTTQQITNLDNSKILSFQSPAGLKLPTNSFDLINREVDNLGFMDNSPVTNVLLTNTISTSAQSVNFNRRLHFYTSDYYSVMTMGDIELIKEHTDASLSNNYNSINSRVVALENKAEIPLGTIIMWSGSSAPNGWSLCNGQTVNGYRTPDVRDRFIVGNRHNWAGGWLGHDPVRKSGFRLGDYGGESTHRLTESELPSHKHVMPWGEAWLAGAPWGYYGGANNAGGNDGADWDNIWRYTSSQVPGAAGDRTEPVSGGAAHDNVPPYYKLAYIMYTG